MGLLKTLGISTGKEKKLKETGIALNGVIKDVAVNNSVSFNGRNPRKLVCTAALPSGELRYFESGNVSAYIQPDVVGQPIMIYVDPKDPKKYYVDAEAYKA
jgi:hypothetical protein